MPMSESRKWPSEEGGIYPACLEATVFQDNQTALGEKGHFFFGGGHLLIGVEKMTGGEKSQVGSV